MDQVATTKDKRGTTSTTTFGSAISGCDYTNRPKETRLSSLSGSTNVLLASLCWNSNAALNYSRQYLDATRPTTWSHSSYTMTDGFDVLKKTPTSSSDTRLSTLSYYNDYWHANIGCFDDTENQLNSLRATYGGSATLNAGSACGVSWTAGTTIDGAIAKMQTGYNSYRGGTNAAFFNYLDVLQGFTSTDFAYRNKVLATSAYSTSFVAGIRNDLQLRDTAQSWVEYTLPSTLVTGATYRFEVDIRKGYTATNNRLSSLSFEIANRSLTAGGGYVGLPTAAPATDNTQQGN